MAKIADIPAPTIVGQSGETCVVELPEALADPQYGNRITVQAPHSGMELYFALYSDPEDPGRHEYSLFLAPYEGKAARFANTFARTTAQHVVKLEVVLMAEMVTETD